MGVARSTSACARCASAVETHAITSHFALPLLIKTPGGLVVEVNDGTDEYNATNYRVSFFYDLAKAAVGRMAFALAHEVEPYGATAVSLTPGWLRSEAMLDAYGVTEATWLDATKISPHFAISETPAFVGRAVVALAQDPERRTLERRVAVERTARAGLRLHRSRREPTGRVAVPRRGPRRRQTGRRHRLSLSRTTAPVPLRVAAVATVERSDRERDRGDARVAPPRSGPVPRVAEDHPTADERERQQDRPTEEADPPTRVVGLRWHAR